MVDTPGKGMVMAVLELPRWEPDGACGEWSRDLAEAAARLVGVSIVAAVEAARRPADRYGSVLVDVLGEIDPGVAAEVTDRWPHLPGARSDDALEVGEAMDFLADRRDDLRANALALAGIEQGATS